VRLPDGLTVTPSLADALEGVSIVFMAVPSHGFRAVLTEMQPLAGEIEAVVSPPGCSPVRTLLGRSRRGIRRRA
jgi:glycerol-3-phosphate dehydrogenase